MELHRAGKEYLKTILVLEQQNAVVEQGLGFVGFDVLLR